ncbi:response regulator [Methanospirillum stamsii]|uniref:histidine kinase n=1 Tax=Methanospirillum stamsii TaxID=1277351 RepID=A0A2V2NHX1_9EURY|nr:response regulator [Methanospirillum stamsii]PWR75201.1 hypothetical protein DLD82_05255 [Methanospirillum stamsii]
MDSRTDQKERILVVDDSPEILGIIRDALEENGFLVSVAKNGEKAIRIATESKPDLILLDILMPEVDGYATLGKLQKYEKTRDIPVIFLTGVADTRNKVKGFSLGAVDFLIKPIEIEELIARVHTHLSINRLKLELIEANRTLEDRVATRTAELTSLTNRLSEEVEIRKKAEQEVRKKNEDLYLAYEQLSQAEEELRSNYEELKIQGVQLKNSERRIRDLIELLPQTIFEIDNSGKILLINQAGLETFKVTPDDIKSGVNVQDYTAESYREQSKIFFDRTFAGEKKNGIEYLAQKKDGTIFPAVLYANAIIENDKPVGVRGIVIDITELKQVHETLEKKNLELIAANRELIEKEDALKINYQALLETDQKLRISESNFRAVLENSSVALFKRNFIKDCYDYISPAITGITGYPIQVMEKMSLDTVFSLILPEDVDTFKSALDKIIATGGGLFTVDYRFVNKSGVITWVHEIGRIFLDEQGYPLYNIGSVQDITDKKTAEEGLSKATRKLNFLNSTVFSDIQNAIFSLSGYLEIGREYTRDETLLKFFEMQNQIIIKIRDSMTFARIFQNLGMKPPERQNVIQVFLYGISHLDMSNYERDIQIEGLEIFADPLLEQVFLSLADNIIRHSVKATAIRLWYKETDIGTTIFFEDNGVGIPDHMKEKVFERDGEEKKGVGLFLSREILSITNITIKETGIFGEGARFEIEVPKGSYWIN